MPFRNMQNCSNDVWRFLGGQCRYSMVPNGGVSMTMCVNCDYIAECEREGIRRIRPQTQGCNSKLYATTKGWRKVR